MFDTESFSIPYSECPSLTGWDAHCSSCLNHPAGDSAQQQLYHGHAANRVRLDLYALKQ